MRADARDRRPFSGVEPMKPWQTGPESGEYGATMIAILKPPAKALALALLIVVSILAPWAFSQSLPSPPVEPPSSEFRFVRLAYVANGLHRMRQSWRTDWPEAEQHFLRGLGRLTHVNAAEDGMVLRVMDDELFDYPWLYAVEVGGWYLDDQEAARLREYLLRGGFLMVDDFHGSREWGGFVESMQRVFPNRPIVELAEGDEVLHVLYDLDKRIQIPSPFVYLRGGRTFEQDGFTPHWRGIYDDAGRLMVAINFNMDLGDAWEHADWPAYPEEFTALAYRFGINYIDYSMTH